ncbi:MAG: septum site-determining protein MinC [Pseudomonadota bacterium]
MTDSDLLVESPVNFSSHPAEQAVDHQNSTPSSVPNQQAGECLQLKGGTFTLTTLELFSYDREQINLDLMRIVKQAPNFFQQTPVVVGLDRLREANEEIDFIQLAELCQEYGLFPIAVRGGTEEHHMSALVAGLPMIPSTKPKIRGQASASQQATTIAEKEISDLNPATATKIIFKTVRSGQQIYARGGDLIILGSVSTGAEVLADGNIHIYGNLRGRALAGVKGRQDARIFCQTLEAELVSIAGHYKISDDLQNGYWGARAQLYLEGRELKMSALE